MAKIKFPLEMANGEQVRTLGDLKDNFDVEKVVGYFLDGKLKTWLEDRYYEDEAEAVASIDKDDTELAKKLCEIFGVEITETESINAEEIAEKNARIEKLKQFTDDEEIIKNIDSVAFNQEELADLYDKGVTTIYLCEGNFNIPDSMRELEYIILKSANVQGLNVTPDKYEFEVRKLSGYDPMLSAMENALAGYDDLDGLKFGIYLKNLTNNTEKLLTEGEDITDFEIANNQCFYINGGKEVYRLTHETKERIAFSEDGYSGIEAIDNQKLILYSFTLSFQKKYYVVFLDGSLEIKLESQDESSIKKVALCNGVCYYNTGKGNLYKAEDFSATHQLLDAGISSKENFKLFGNKIFYEKWEHNALDIYYFSIDDNKKVKITTVYSSPFGSLTMHELKYTFFEDKLFWYTISPACDETVKCNITDITTQKTIKSFELRVKSSDDLYADSEWIYIENDYDISLEKINYDGTSRKPLYSAKLIPVMHCNRKVLNKLLKLKETHTY